MDNLEQTPRITLLKEKMLNEPRYVSIEQARIITRIYQENESLSIPKKTIVPGSIISTAF